MRRPAQLGRRRITAPRSRGRSIRRIFHSLWWIRPLQPQIRKGAAADARHADQSLFRIKLEDQTPVPTQAYPPEEVEALKRVRAGEVRTIAQTTDRAIREFARLRTEAPNLLIRFRAADDAASHSFRRNSCTPRIIAAASGSCSPRAARTRPPGHFLWQHREIRVPARKGFVELSKEPRVLGILFVHRLRWRRVARPSWSRRCAPPRSARPQRPLPASILRRTSSCGSTPRTQGRQPPARVRCAAAGRVRGAAQGAAQAQKPRDARFMFRQANGSAMAASCCSAREAG